VAISGDLINLAPGCTSRVPQYGHKAARVAGAGRGFLDAVTTTWIALVSAESTSAARVATLAPRNPTWIALVSAGEHKRGPRCEAGANKPNLDRACVGREHKRGPRCEAGAGPAVSGTLCSAWTCPT